MILSRVVNAYKVSFVGKMSEVVKRDAERAQRVHDNLTNQTYAIQHQIKLKKKVSLQSSIEQLQNQMRQEIARSLKTSENKVLYQIKLAEQSYKSLQNKELNSQEKDFHNQLIKQCEKVRWQFMVHRQAVGFTIKNYELVTSIYKIPPKLL